MPVEVDAVRVFVWWARNMPARIVARARPVRLDHGILIVHTASSAWAQELSFMTGDIVARLRKAELGVDIRSVRFRSGALPPALERRAGPKKPAPPIDELPELPAEVGRALARVHDDDLRLWITRAAAASLARNES